MKRFIYKTNNGKRFGEKDEKERYNTRYYDESDNRVKKAIDCKKP